MPKNILVVDDEADIRDAVGIILSKEGFNTVFAENGLQAVERISCGERFKLIIMDIIMPGLDGVKAAQLIRGYTDCPILFLTAKSADDDKLLAYNAGGDDYVSKPFSPVELMLRVKALLKRSLYDDTEAVTVDVKNRSVKKNGEPVALTEKEFELLSFLYTHRGQPFSNEEIYENVWKQKYMHSSSNTVMVHILNLRKKLEDDFTNPKYILTVWGKGYGYVEEK